MNRTGRLAVLTAALAGVAAFALPGAAHADSYSGQWRCCVARSADVVSRPGGRQIARASSVNAASTRSAGLASTPSS